MRFGSVEVREWPWSFGRYVFGSVLARCLPSIYCVSCELQFYHLLSCLQTNIPLITPSLQEPDAVIDPEETFPITKEDAAQRAIESFESVFRHGTKIELDHFLVYFARKSSHPPPFICKMFTNHC